MPTVSAPGPGNVYASPYWLKTPEYSAIDVERQRHNEAVMWYGEYSIFAMLWNIEDFTAGRVVRCPNCFTTGTTKAGIIASAYGQANIYKCPFCYGSTFWDPTPGITLPGLRARIVRPTLWTTNDDEWKTERQGQMILSDAKVQATSTFRLRSGDYIFKADGTRWRVQDRTTNAIITGFQPANDIRAMVAYLYPRVIREDESNVCYTIPPLGATNVINILDVSPVPNYPVTFETILPDVVNGPLIEPTDLAPN
jgi:hypothetical protein